MFLFSEDCRIGVEQIDNEHKHLFDLLNDALFWLQNEEYEGNKYEKVRESLRNLEEYSDRHFALEEAYMEEIQDPQLILQRTQHRAFRKHMEEFLNKNIDEEEYPQEALEEMIHFLAGWWYHHIIGSDALIGKLPSQKEGTERENFEGFSDEYVIGVNIIDHEHKYIFGILRRINDLVQSWSENDKLDDIVSVFDEFKAYTEIHFEDEEAYMQSINFDGYEAQKRAHEALVAKLEEIDLEKIDQDPRAYMESLILFLKGWLINHVLHMDSKIPGRKDDYTADRQNLQ